MYKKGDIVILNFPFNINTIDKDIIIGKLGEIGTNELTEIKKIFCNNFCK